MVLIYAHKVSPRLDYAARLIFRDILESDVELTSDRDFFTASHHPKINYSDAPLGDELFLKAGELLFSKSIQLPDIHPIETEGETGFFATSPESFLPFDPLASTFLIASRMEEYQPGYRDAHGRFPATLSILFRHGLLETPVIDRWALLISLKIKQKYPNVQFHPRKARYLCTIDIDNARAFLHKGFVRTTAAFTRDLLSGSFRRCLERVRVLSGANPDPYATESYIQTLFKGREKFLRIFILAGDYSAFDKQIPWSGSFFKSYVRKLSRQCDLGVHPSYKAGKADSPELLLKEKNRLEKMIEIPIVASRQHYLLLQFPATYRKLETAGILEDYSMGFHDLPGFRAGTCTPHFFYDLGREKMSSLKIYPFQAMDVTLRQYMELSPEEACKKIDKLMKEVRKTGGLFCAIWHNESVSGKGVWKEYRQVFEHMNQLGFSYAEQ